MLAETHSKLSASSKNSVSTTNASWTPDSWRARPIQQQPNYGDANALAEVEVKLAHLPSLVTPEEVRSLKAELADVALGKAFLLQGGDCAESFAEFNESNLRDYARVMLQMTTALMYGAGSPVVKVGRIAGQFAKPRSADMEEEQGICLPSYRGDMVNGMEFEETSRKAEPERLLQAYNQSATTLNFLRSLFGSGFAALDRISEWNTDFVAQSNQGKRFATLVDNINNCMRFMHACGITPAALPQLAQASFYCSHEGLLLGYEQALVRRDAEDGQHYACSAHMLWIGERTRSLEEAHVEFMRGIANPVGCKASAKMEPDTLLRLCDALNPQNEPGKLVLITRMGAGKAAEHLPKLVQAVKREGRHVVWSCDPMHGNTIKSPNGYKTRKFTDILTEVRDFFAVHAAEGTHAGGVHFEMTGQDVTECLGGAQAISEVDLGSRYHTHCDPRLNASQALELAFLIAEGLKQKQGV